MSLVDECISCTSKLWTVKDCFAIKSATCVMAFESVAKITGENYLNPTAVSDDLDEHIIHGKTTSTRFWYMSSSFLSASLNFLTNCYQSKFFQMTTILQIFYRFILLQINISSQMESHL